jgi:hypothetical protein
MKLDVVGAQEVAQMFDVEVTRVWRWGVKEGRLPPIIADLAATPVWHRPDLAKIARRYKMSGKTPPFFEAFGDARIAPREGQDSKLRIKPFEVELVGLAEVAAMLGLENDKKAIGRWRKSGAFPEPLLDKRRVGVQWRAKRGLAATPLWDKGDIERFAAARAAA